MYAIIETDGKQVRVAEGDTIRCDAIGHEPGSEIAFRSRLNTPFQAGRFGLYPL